MINESWRIYPPAWTPSRKAVEAFDLDGYHFQAGTIAIFSQWVLHHLPDIWGDPDVFRPERWDPVNGQQVPQSILILLFIFSATSGTLDFVHFKRKNRQPGPAWISPNRGLKAC